MVRPVDFLRRLDADVEWSSAYKTYLTQCTEDALLADSGCFCKRDARRLRKRLLHAREGHKVDAKCPSYVKPSVAHGMAAVFRRVACMGVVVCGAALGGRGVS